jgi:hypothetical protein
MAEFKPQLLPAPPTKEQLIEVFRRSVPEEYWAGLEGHPSMALFRAMAAQWEVNAAYLASCIQARFHKDHALAVDSPATLAEYARGDVTLTRTANWEQELIIEPGQIRIEVLNREYTNEETITWNPGDHGERTVSFRSVVALATTNMDHIANDDGLIDLDLISIVDRARNRAGVDATVSDSPSIISDNGIDDIFNVEDVGIYVDINQSSDTDNTNRRRKILGWTWPEVEYPLGTGRYPRRIMVDESPRQNALEVLYYDGATYTDLTVEATEEGTAADVTPLVGAVNRAVYFASAEEVKGVVVDIDTVGVGDWNVVWEYWDQSATWQPLQGVVDPTNGWRPLQPGEYTITWTMPTDLPVLTSPGGSGLEGYYVRARVDSHTSLTTQPVISRVTIKPWVPLDDADETQWVLYDALSLGVQVVECEAFTGGRDQPTGLY